MLRRIVNGNTEIGIEVKFKHMSYPVLIAATHVAELRAVRAGPDGVDIGAAATLTDIELALRQWVAHMPEHQTRTFRALLENIRWFAGQQVRNVAALGGNLATASPISDLNPILFAADATATVASHTNGRRTVAVSEFFTGYRKTVLQPSEVLVTIHVPFTSPDDHIEAFKQAKRRDDDIAIVNAALRVVLSPQPVDGGAPRVLRCRLVYGGMAPVTVAARRAEAALTGQLWTDAVVGVVSDALLEDFPLRPDTPGGAVEYRRVLAASFFFKFYLMLSQRLGAGHAIDAAAVSATERAGTPLWRARQDFEVADGTGPGASVPHLSAVKQVTGEAVYVDDMSAHENELHAALVLSERAHARIEAIDASAALAVAGVHAFYAARDVPGSNHWGSVAIDEEVFASDTVTCVGQPVGIVVAATQALAQEAARMVRIAYRDLPSILSIEEAIAAQSFFTTSHSISDLEYGNVDAAMAAADHRIEGELRIGGQEHFYFETQSCIAVPSAEDGAMTLISSTQNPTHVQDVIAEVLGVPSNRVICKIKRLGGGFGGKETRSIALAAAVAVAARRSGRPVRCILDRDEDMMFKGGRHPFLVRYKVGFSRDGRFQAVDVQFYSNAGNTLDLSSVVMESAIFAVDNAYRVRVPVVQAPARLHFAC